MNLDVRDLGKDRDFDLIWQHQEKLVAQRRSGEIGDTLLLLEHQPVYTIGRTRDQSSLGVTAHLPHPVVEINRGGEGTYHGPGQLTGYAILDLTHYRKDLHLHLRNLEEGIILTLRHFGVAGQRRPGLTGVWVEDRKIASLGVGVRAWVTLHGMALNVNRSCLQPFEHITPCGLGGVSMTSIESEADQPIEIDKVKTVFAGNYLKVLEAHYQAEG
ncbi:MAG: lipoyl(octanoyl) transferase LipB [Verrucomicrobiaceae bacterium]